MDPLPRIVALYQARIAIGCVFGCSTQVFFSVGSITIYSVQRAGTYLVKHYKGIFKKYIVMEREPD